MRDWNRGNHDAYYYDDSFRRWHKKLGNYAACTDIDAMTYCGICPKPAPLAVIESTRRPWHKTAVLTSVAQRLNVPGMLITFDAGTPVSAQVMAPGPDLDVGRKIYGQDNLALVLHQLRYQHVLTFHPELSPRLQDLMENNWLDLWLHYRDSA